ncbi:MAG: hypothetical protein QNK23_15640 [Crocinitomicaceae bacterium]|nr:hypothetical protein [Crocinitomicaceae bacterium]
MNNKDSWIEETLNTDKIVGRVEPSDALMKRLKAIPSHMKESYDLIPKKVVWAVAASIAILICVNIVSYNNYEPNEAVSQNEPTESYFSYLQQL